MKSITVVGDTEFVLGFRLAGIKQIVDVSSYGIKKVEDELVMLLHSKELGIVIIDQKVLEGLNEHLREDIVSSISPVFVAVSETAAQDELRKMILQSIGVDLLKEEN